MGSFEERSFRRVLAAATSVAVVYTIVVGLHLGGPRVSMWIDDLGMIVAAGAACFASAAAARRARERARRAWLFMAFATGAWAIGETFWAIYELLLGRDAPFPSFADVFYLAGIPLTILALLNLADVRRVRQERLRMLLDGMILAASVLLTSWVFLLQRLLPGQDNALAAAVSVAYPIGDVVIIVIALLLVARARGRWRGPLAILVVGMCLQAVADTLFTYLTAVGDFDGGFIEGIWFAGYVFMALAAYRARLFAGEPASAETRVSVANVVLPYAGAIASIVVRVVQELRGQNRAFLFWSGVAILILVLMRLMVTIVDNVDLTRGLEAKVAARTAELRASEQRFRSLVQNAYDVITLLDRAGTIGYQSTGVEALVGRSAESLGRTPFDELILDADRPALRAVLDQMAEGSSRSARLDLRMMHADGSLRETETTLTNLLADPDVAGVVLNTRDVTDRKSLERELLRSAFQDPLTGLPNRASFRERIDFTIARAPRTRGTPAVLLLDLDRFKVLNDSYGHTAGDDLLVQVGRRLEATAQQWDTVARLSGDEFGVLIEDARDAAGATEAARRMLACLQHPFEVAGHQVHLSATVGIAIRDGEDADELLRNADVAMYVAKSRGIESQVFEPAAHGDLLERAQLEAELRRALELGQLFLRYQPVVSLSNGSICGAEALIRWNHPGHGEVSPTRFVPIAEETGLIVPIGSWVLREAVAQAVAWNADSAEPLKINVNVSARQLQEPGFVDEVASVLAQHDLDPVLLVLEITESIAMRDAEETIARLNELKALGIRLAIDDFGTGYSSLSYLRRLPADFLKIDRSFVTDVTTSAEASALARGIARLGKTLNLEIVAEGVETAEQAAALAAMGCENAQGYYYARPLPALDFEEMLARERDPDHDAEREDVRALA